MWVGCSKWCASCYRKCKICCKSKCIDELHLTCKYTGAGVIEDRYLVS